MVILVQEYLVEKKKLGLEVNIPRLYRGADIGSFLYSAEWLAQKF